jgi:hypothetical protein
VFWIRVPNSDEESTTRTGILIAKLYHVMGECANTPLFSLAMEFHFWIDDILPPVFWGQIIGVSFGLLHFALG